MVRTMTRRRLLPKPRTEDHRNFAGDTAKGSTSPSQSGIELRDGFDRAENLFQDGSVFEKTFAMRMARIQPVLNQPASPFGEPPEKAAVLETRDVVVGSVRTPDLALGD
jgi:hypothetical protein